MVKGLVQEEIPTPFQNSPAECLSLPAWSPRQWLLPQSLHGKALGYFLPFRDGPPPSYFLFTNYYRSTWHGTMEGTAVFSPSLVIINWLQGCSHLLESSFLLHA